jgi:class 3 adenylate cyclase
MTRFTAQSVTVCGYAAAAGAVPKIKEHGGRTVKNTGDGLLAEFPSVVDAVRCAAEVQRRMIDREPEAPDERRIRFRIGINLGDVIVEEHDIFGDGVNVAARLEALAEPGGIWCSEASCHSSGCKSRQHKESSPCCSDTQRQGG